MILLDKPYVSDFLKKTIKENNIRVISTASARELAQDDSLNWITEKEARDILNNNPFHTVYTNSENSISWIERNFTSSKILAQIKLFKDKLAFRDLIKDSYPDYFYEGVKFKDLENYDLSKIKFPVIVKPAVGFFSIGVHIVNNPVEWKEAIIKIEDEIKKLNGLYPKEVIDISDFIIEECIEGEEYAIDAYYNGEGKPVILNIFHHIFSSDNDVSDRVYSTSEEIINRHKKEITLFLLDIGAKTDLKNFPVHVEIRINGDGKINPIEINPLRFGGWCTTADLTWHAYGINSYNSFLKGTDPDWVEIFKTRKGKKYSIIVLDNSTGLPNEKIDYFDYDKILKDFRNPLELRKVDFKKFHIFGFLFVETMIGKEEELERILSSTLKEYIKVKDLAGDEIFS